MLIFVTNAKCFVKKLKKLSIFTLPKKTLVDARKWIAFSFSK